MKRLPAVLLLCSFQVFVPLLARAEDPPAKHEGPAGQTQTRDGECFIAAEFGVRVVPPKDATDNPFKSHFAGVRNGLVVPSNGHIELGFKNLKVAPLSGTVTFTFFRGPSGQNAVQPSHPYSFPLANNNALAQFNDPNAKGTEALRLDAPPSLNANNTPKTEQIRIVASFKPDSLPKACAVTDYIVMQWSWNQKTDSGNNWPFTSPQAVFTIPGTRSRVDFSPGIIDETSGFPGKVNKATQTVVLFAVKNAFRCCDQADRGYAIVQFVRHEWQLGSGKKQSDEWNLDGAPEQSRQHAKGQDYDPTYTNHPGKSSNELVQAGPWDDAGNSPAITVYDFPGLLNAEHDRFVKEGGWISWEFVTFLVCAENPADQKKYLASGQVQAQTHYKIKRTYTAGEPVPTVAAGELKSNPEPKSYDKACVALNKLLEQYKLTDAFKDPRPHVIDFK